MTTSPRDILTVSRLNRTVRTALEGQVGAVWVEGEISNLARPSSGHWYFSLKDANAQVRCAMFRTRNEGLAFVPVNGSQVLIAARVSLYEPRGEFQLIVEQLEPAGEGLLRLKFEALKQRLAQAGMFASEHKRALPRWPHTLGVITSATGAALRDILQVLRHRNPSLPVILYPSPVQGAAAIPALVDAIETANRRNECAVLILARGGGSLEDLWAFNEEAVVRAIYHSKIPIVSGIGHEIDFTLADFVADVRAPTPSAAAALCTPEATEVVGLLLQFERRIVRNMEVSLQRLKIREQHAARRLVHPGRRIEQHHQRLDELQRRLPQEINKLLLLKRARLQAMISDLINHNPGPQLAHAGERARLLSHRLPAAMATGLSRWQNRAALALQTLNTVSPTATLARGYAIVTDTRGQIARDASLLRVGEQVVTQLAAGKFTSRVDETDPV
ncbi:MAG: exodeoxyribonuclease VII large subunit [Gammaproteobacteria bacterium]|nr:exodeoxyribonuclease VII large subunit [Gammaproteobacteria bacterium]